MKGGARFLHNFGTNNTVLGSNAGNFAMSGRDNTAGACVPVSIRIASFGHASTQKPQTMQRISSMTNFTGYFSIGSSGYSPASM